VALTKLFRLNESGKGGRVLVRTVQQSRPFIASRSSARRGGVRDQLARRVVGPVPVAVGVVVSFTRFALAHLTGRGTPGGTHTAGDPLVRVPAGRGAGVRGGLPAAAGRDRAAAGEARAAGRGQRRRPAVGHRPNTGLPGVYRIVGEEESLEKAPCSW